MIRTLAAIALVAATAAAQPPASTGPAGAAPSPARSCIDLADVTNRHAEDSRTIRFDLIGGRAYRNRLGGDCPGLRAAADGFGSLVFDVHGGRLCRGDLVRVTEPGGARANLRAAIPCPLGDFIPESRPPGGNRR
jgi:hypothetical protein